MPKLSSAPKPHLLLVHGFRGHSAGLATLAHELSHDFQVFTPDLPPANHHNLQKYDLDHYLAYLHQYTIDHHLVCPILVGHSMGSILVAAFAEKYPKSVASPVFLLAPISHKPPLFISIFQPLIVFLPSSFISFITTHFLFVSHNHQLFQYALDLTNISAGHYHSKIALLRSAFFAATHSVSKFKPPQKVVIIAGASDRLISLKSTRQLAQYLSAQLEIIPNSGHLINYENPVRVAQIITSEYKPN